MTLREKKALRDGVSKTILRLERARFGRPRSSKDNAANLHMATALCICCFIDAMGKYIYGGQADECKFKRFIERYTPLFYKELIDKARRDNVAEKEKYLTQFYREVRCGLVHGYFPKSNSEIVSRSGSAIVSSNVGKLRICVPRLRENFLQGFEKAIRDI